MSVPAVPMGGGWPAWRFLRRMIAFRAWLWGPNALSIVLLIMLETVPGLLARQFFDWLGAGATSLEPFWWLLALLAAATTGRVAFLVGCQFTNAPFMYTSAALLQHNMLRRLLQLPGAAALPHSSGEALSRFRDDVDETSLFLIPFNDLIAWALFALVGLAVMISVNPTITVGVFLPLVAVSALVHAGRTRIESYRRAVRFATACSINSWSRSRATPPTWAPGAFCCSPVKVCERGRLRLATSPCLSSTWAGSASLRRCSGRCWPSIARPTC